MIEWAKLVSQGRAKAVGVSWTEEEAVAVAAKPKGLGIPADYVRKGILTLEAYEEVKGTIPNDTRTKEELLKEAKKKGIAATPEASKEVLKEEINKKESKKETVKETVERSAVKKKFGLRK